MPQALSTTAIQKAEADIARRMPEALEHAERCAKERGRLYQARYHRERARDYIERAKLFRASLKDWDCPDEDATREWMDDAIICARQHLNEARAIERECRPVFRQAA